MQGVKANVFLVQQWCWDSGGSGMEAYMSNSEWLYWQCNHLFMYNGETEKFEAVFRVSVMICLKVDL